MVLTEHQGGVGHRAVPATLQSRVLTAGAGAADKRLRSKEGETKAYGR